MIQTGDLKVLYRKRLVPTEQGLAISTERWCVVRESAEFYYLALAWRAFDCIAALERGRSLASLKLKKIGKHTGRFAFATEPEALAHLIMLKKRQQMHLEREMAFNKVLLDLAELEGGVAAYLVASEWGYLLIPDTSALVNSRVNFN